MVKMTFTLDDETVASLHRAADRTARPRSAVVRDAIKEYERRLDRLTEQEQLRLLRLFDEHLAVPSRRPAADVDREMRAVRSARRTGGRRTAPASST